MEKTNASPKKEKISLSEIAWTGVVIVTLGAIAFVGYYVVTNETKRLKEEAESPVRQR